MGMSIREIVDGLTEQVGVAEAAKDAGADARKIRDALNKASNVLSDYSGATVEGDVLRYFLDTGVHMLNSEADGFDRESGNTLARKARGVVEADLADEEFGEGASEWITALVDRWNTLTKSTKTGARRSGESQVPDLGFTVKVKDESTGQTVASTTKKNLNSLRDQLRKHHEKEHGSKPSKGEPIWQGITDALKAVMENGSQSAQGGGYIVDKAA